MNETEERCYMSGQRQVWRKLFAQCVHELGLKGDELKVAMLLKELEDTRASLRILCEDFGDNDWDDSLHLADVVDKHLGRHLHANCVTE